MKQVAVIPGDGIGREVIREAVRCLEVLQRKFALPLQIKRYDQIHAERYLRERISMTEQEFQEIASADAILLGAVGDPRLNDTPYAKEVVLQIRFRLDLYVNLRPVVLYHPDFTPLARKDRGIRFYIIRENTEDLYVGMGGRFKPDTEEEIAVQEALYSYKGTHRILKFAFEFARQKGLRKVTMVDKSNVLVIGHGLWQRIFWQLAKEYPEMEAQHLYVDNAAMQIVKRPWDFEVLVTTNMFGDILSDLASEVVGGLGVAPSANLNPETGKGMFEPVHGSAPKYAGKNVANPIAAVLSAVLLLRHLGFQEAAQALEDAVTASFRVGLCTRDLGGSASTSEVGDFLVEHLETSASRVPS